MIYSLTVTNTIGESLTFELSNPWASGYAIKTIDGLGTPDMNVNTTPYGIGDGSVLGSIKADYRLITIILYPLASPTVETARQRLYRYFQIKKNILLTFNTENRLVTIDGYVQKIEPSIFENPESISIEIKCVDPYFHRMAEDQTKFYGIQPLFEFPFSNGFEFISTGGWNDGVLVDGSRLIDWSSVASGNGVNVIFPNLSRVGPLYSSNGIDWSQAEYSGYNNWTSLVFGNDIFVSCNKSYMIGVSQDGKNWDVTKVNLPNDLQSNGSLINIFIIFGNGLFLRSGYIRNVFSGSYTPFADYSVDGREWKPVELPSSYDGLRIDKGIYAFGKFILVSMMDKKIMYSTDLKDWVEYPLDIPIYIYHLRYANGVLLAYNMSDAYVYFSKDMLVWNKAGSLELEEPTKFDVAYINGKFILAYSGFFEMEDMDSGEVNFIQLYAYGVYESSDCLSWSKVDIDKNLAWNRILSIGNGYALIPIYSNTFVYYTPAEIGYLSPIEFSSFTIDNRMEIDYQGEIDAGIQITIECQSPPGDIIIYHVETLEYIQIFSERIEAVSGAPLGPKDIIEINTDSGNKYVRLLRNGVYYNILGAMNRGMTWFTLKQGPNTYTYTTTDEHAAISMTFSYRDTYAAI